PRARVALDPDQFGRAAADIEQDGAAAPGVEQRRTADYRQSRLGFAIDDLEPDPGLRCNPLAKAIGVAGGAAGFGSDQPQAPGFSRLDLVPADAERRNGPLDRRLADQAGGG